MGVVELKPRCGWPECTEHATYKWYRKVNTGFMFLCDKHLSNASNVHVDNKYEELADSKATRLKQRSDLIERLQD